MGICPFISESSGLLLQFLYLCYLALEFGARLEGRNVVLGHDDCLLLGDVTCGLGSTLLQVESTETTQENVLAICHGVLDDIHESLNRSQGGRLVDTSLV